MSTSREAFEVWCDTQYRMERCKGVAWSAWQAATLVAKDNYKLEMVGVIQELATHGNQLTNLANNLAKVRR